MDDNQKMNKTEMLARANQAINEVAIEFTETPNDQRDEDLFRELYPMMSHVISDI
jgi:hypothetical protein